MNKQLLSVTLALLIASVVSISDEVISDIKDVSDYMNVTGTFCREEMIPSNGLCYMLLTNQIDVYEQYSEYASEISGNGWGGVLWANGSISLYFVVGLNAMPCNGQFYSADYFAMNCTTVSSLTPSCYYIYNRCSVPVSTSRMTTRTSEASSKILTNISLFIFCIMTVLFL